MCVTLLLIQTFVGTFRTGDPGAAPTPTPDVVATPPGGTVRIMVAGDSIAQGSSGDHTWRYRLWRHLESGADVDFVGPYDDLLDAATGDFGDHSYADPEFDRAHAAVWGATAEDVAAGIGEQVAQHDPHYLLLMAGTNDLVRGGTAEDALNGVRDAVDTARVARGDIRVVLGELTPVWGTGADEETNTEVAAFNSALPRLAAQLNGADSPVVVAATADGYDPADDNWDTTHPNARGEVKIAAAFADTLAGPLGLGEPYPRPLPEVEIGPRTAPEVQVADDGTEAVLTWDPVPGATSYQVLQQRVRPDPDDLVPLPMEVAGAAPDEGRTARVDRLLSGATYAFVVRPYKGGDAGRASERVEVTVDTEPPPAPERVRIEEDGGGPVLVWEPVAEAGHYEIWSRPLECRPDPTPSPGRGRDAADGDCAPRDGEGPRTGAGWAGVAVVDGDPRWPIAADGHGAYEFAVRSHRDYVPGGFSTPVSHPD
ncbi:GDSL-type esterase/lipase family protein [Nocardiopsis trehalosi]|uniref:GDSL-type esterase/lipase family protein n=1 Tax=Nocardiopsis trehalosi TaxID=109329 RepID=UPI001FE02AA1|nr:GDSL-type esterase/lipase family protein [Nocardiopsis trehalosi]